MNLLQYAQKMFSTPLATVPLTPADLCLLNELAYLPVDAIARDQNGFDRGISAAHIHQEFLADRDLKANWFLATSQRLHLLKLVAGSVRFAGLRFFYYRARADVTEQVQFAALTLVVPGVFRQVIFRGTDDSLIGWKEDFHLAAQQEIPAQALAVDYLHKDLQQPARTPIYVTGHSKGGHLAIFALASQPRELQERVQQVLAFDAPGFSHSFLTNPGYLRVLPKVQEFVPEDSIVGRLMFRESSQQVVASGSFGLMQHSVFFWQVDEQGQFVPKDAATGASERVARVTATWLERHAPEDIQRVVDTCFDLAMGEGYSSLLTIGVNVVPFIQVMRAKSAELDPDSYELVSRLIDDFLQLWREQKKLEKQERQDARPTWLAAPQKMLEERPLSSAVTQQLSKLLERDSSAEQSQQADS